MPSTGVYGQTGAPPVVLSSVVEVAVVEVAVGSVVVVTSVVGVSVVGVSVVEAVVVTPPVVGSLVEPVLVWVVAVVSVSDAEPLPLLLQAVASAQQVRIFKMDRSRREGIGGR
jgi:hypothetical protein